MISSKTERARRRAKVVKTFLTEAYDILKIALGVVAGVGILWIIQVGVTLL